MTSRRIYYDVINDKLFRTKSLYGSSERRRNNFGNYRTLTEGVEQDAIIDRIKTDRKNDSIIDRFPTIIRRTSYIDTDEVNKVIPVYFLSPCERSE